MDTSPQIMLKCFYFVFRPVIVIGGSSDVDQESMGAFQEFPQVCTID